MLVDPDGQKADDVSGEAQLMLKLGHGVGRRVDVHQREMRLAVLLDAEGEALEPPIFGLADGPAATFDDRAVLLHQAFDLLRGDVLARQEHMLIKRHGLAFPSFWLRRVASHGPWKERPKKTTLGSGDRGARLMPAASSEAALLSASDRSGFEPALYGFGRALQGL